MAPVPPFGPVFAPPLAPALGAGLPAPAAPCPADPLLSPLPKADSKGPPPLGVPRPDPTKGLIKEKKS